MFGGFMALFVVVIIVILALIVLKECVFTVQTQTRAIVERFGEFVRVAHPGLNFKVPFIERRAGTISLRQQTADITFNIKTKDNVFVDVLLSIQYQVDAGDDTTAAATSDEQVRNAFYRLTDVEGQIERYVQDSVRAKVPTLDLDEAFEKKDEIQNKVNADLEGEIREFGYKIVRTLLRDVSPNAEVKAAMNAVNIAQRHQVAATAQGEANKIAIVKQAEADAESKRLAGVGIANQRQAIAEGFRRSIDELKNAGVDEAQVSNILLITQYFDTINDIRAKGATTLLLPGGPDAVGKLGGQMLESILTANTMDKAKPLAQVDPNVVREPTVSTTKPTA